jgi:phenylpyruvate tautomerase PptA (4-oxalocrotonate tautomerase family)
MHKQAGLTERIICEEFHKPRSRIFRNKLAAKELRMTDVLIEVRGDWLKKRKSSFIEAVEDAITASLQTPKDDKVLRLVEHSPECFSIPMWASERFTLIEITMFKGRSMEVKRALYRAIVKSLEPFGVPPNDVKIILVEVQPSQIGMRGGAAVCDVDILDMISLFSR